MEAYKIDPAGKHCVVIGRSNIVGKPMALLLLQKNGTVTICHSGTKDLKAQTLQADILISAVGKTGFVTEDMVKDGAVVIDVAMNRNAEGKLCGDVDYAAVSQKASAITPVPGGVGPMTRVMLLENTLTAAASRTACNVTWNWIGSRESWRNDFEKETFISDFVGCLACGHDVPHWGSQ